jgi:hypothetical protein
MILIEFTPAQAAKLRDLVANENATTKNHIASAVEHDRPADHKFSARNLVAILRENEALFAKVNGAILRADGIIK